MLTNRIKFCHFITNDINESYQTLSPEGKRLVLIKR